ncbi:MAG: hypothetical protein IKF52_06275 [Clostridia bacterium]|nr:hypothetical protein [Clostridia bacterium]
MSDFRFRNNKGITMIALIITIIILLILAGITIAMAFGDNGIITRTRVAKDATEEADEREKIEMAVFEAFGLKKTNSGDEDYVSQAASKLTNSNEAISKLNSELRDYLKDGETITSLPATVTGKSGAKYNISDKGEVKTISKDSTVANITASDYGAYVDVGVDINGDGKTTNDFRVFLNDGDNVYLIAADYVSSVPYTKGNDTTNGHEMSAGNTSYKYYWNTNTLGDYSGSSNIVINFRSQLSIYHKWLYKTIYSNDGTYENEKSVKAIAYMLDKAAWNYKYKTKNNSNYVDYVVGGPTLEQFAASYNAVHTTTVDQIFYSESGNTGYYVKKGSAPGTSDFSAQLSTADNNLYFITSQDKALAAWLASPSAFGEQRVVYANCNGIVHSINYNANMIGFRPLVCLQSGVSIVDTDEDGIYELQ